MPALSETVIQEGIFSGAWAVRLEEYRGPDFSRHAFLFTGQGAAAPGMFRAAFDSLEPFRVRFRKADELATAAGLPPVSLYVTDPQRVAEAHLSIVRNLALVTAQVALFEHLTGKGREPRMLTGFSLGEFPVLACAGVIGFEEMLEAVLARDRSCPADNQLGHLIAVAESPKRIGAVLNPRDFFTSNINSALQTAIAVTPGRLESVLSALTAANLRHKLLATVPQPYHSPLMKESAARFRTWLERRKLQGRAPSIPVFSSILHDWLPSRNLSASELTGILSRQLTEPVDFPRQIEAAYTAGNYAFLELGPGATLSAFARETLTGREHRIVELAPLIPVEQPAARPARAEQAKSPIFARLRAAIAKVTGYDIESISVEDRFQEDLGIDSIKKANILFTVLKEEDTLKGGYDSSAVRNIGDAIAALSGGTQDDIEEALPVREPRFSRFALNWRRQDLPPVAGSSEFTVVRLGSLERIPDGKRLVLIADQAKLDVSTLARTLNRCRALTQGEAVLVTFADNPPLAAGLPAFFRGLRKERPALFFRHIHFDRTPAPGEILQAVAREVESGNQDLEVRYCGGSRWVASLDALPEDAGVSALPNDAVIVAIGGGAGIGKVLLENLETLGDPTVYIAGRSPREGVNYRQVDATDPQAVRSLLEAVHQKHGRIDLILNTTGIQKSALLESKTVEEIRDELDAKITPAANIFHACQGLNVGLVVHSSSIVARWGNSGQTVYACANEALNRMTEEYNRAAGRTAAISIEWPAWDGVGMTADPAVLNRLRRAGFSLLGPRKAAELLKADLSQPVSGTVRYADAADFPVLGAGLRDHRRVAAVIGNPAATGFERVFDNQRDLWLQDHAIDGTCYLPAASAITMALTLGRLAGSKDYNLVEDFKLQRPVEVRETPVTLRLELFGRDHGVGVRGRTDGPVFRCGVGKASESTGAGARTVAWGPCQGYHKGLLFHGPVFQMLHETGFAPDGRLAGRIATARLTPVYGVPEADRLTLWLDGAFQLLALEAVQRFGSQVLPVEVRRLALHAFDRPPQSLTLWLSGVERQDGAVCGDITARGDEGETIFRMEGVRMAVIRAIGMELAG